MITNLKKKAAAVLLSVLFISTPMRAYGHVPWSQVNGRWISADGKTPIDGALEKGITITKYQNKKGAIDWRKVGKEDISFAMVLLGNYDEQDPYFDENMKGAEAAGIKAGVCFYGMARNAEEARKEAEYVLDIVKDYRVSYPISYDIESSPLLDGKYTRKQVTELVNAFCREIEEAGYRAVVFGDNEWMTEYMDVRKISYDIWYSRYGMANTFANRTIWRCTESGTVNGIQGNVCLEFSFDDYEESFLGTGWRQINGEEYYFYDYRMVKDTALYIDGIRYIFDRKGRNIIR